MTRAPGSDLKPVDLVDDVERTLEALRQAAIETYRRHKREGHPIVVWRNGRVEWIAPEDIPDTLDELDALRANESTPADHSRRE